MFKIVVAAGLLATLGFVPLESQVPGQYPPGQYPPGQYPPGQGNPNGGLSLPKLGRKKSQKPAENAVPTILADGHTVSSDDKKLVVVVDDGRTLTMTVTPKTTYTRAGSTIERSKVVPRSLVHVEAAEDDEAFLTAVKVEYLKDPPVDASEPAAQQPSSYRPSITERPGGEERPGDLDLSQPAPEAPDRPVLRRGKPKQQGPHGDDDASAAASSSPGNQPAQTGNQPVATAKTNTAKSAAKKKDDVVDFTIGDDKPIKTSKSASDALLDRSKEWAATFTQGLPNFVCKQLTTRYLERSKSTGWEALDVVTATVVYEDGKEDYREITVGGRKTNKNMMELGGSTSTGEFASVLQSLFSGYVNAEFKYYRSSTSEKAPASIYDFKVALKNSDWTITVGGQSLRPVYSGSIWIDRATAQVRRIEMQADNIPKDFPDDAVASAVDYDEVHLGTSTFLLPVHAENLSCQRGTTICTKNTIDFRDYHKYSGESTVTFK